MSKKNKNSNVNTEVVDQVVETPVEEAPIAEEEKVEEPVVETPVPVEETPIVEDNVAEVPVEEPIVEEVPTPELEVVSEPVVETPVEEPAPDTAEMKVSVEGEDPLGPVDYFVQLNKEPFTEEKLEMVETRLAKYDLKYFVTAEGVVLVGPYLTKDGAINGRRLVIRSGLKGEIVEIPKD